MTFECIILVVWKRRGGRAAEGAALEMLWCESIRGFKSHPFLHAGTDIAPFRFFFTKQNLCNIPQKRYTAQVFRFIIIY